MQYDNAMQFIEILMYYVIFEFNSSRFQISKLDSTRVESNSKKKRIDPTRVEF